MHVMEVISGSGINGAIVHCKLLASELTRRGHRVTLVCRPGAWIADQLRNDVDRVIESSVYHLDITGLRSLIRQASNIGVDVIHTHQSDAHSCGILLRLFTGIPSVASAHSVFIQLHWPLNNYVIATSESVMRFHRRYNLVRSSRIRMIPNFVELERSPMSSSERERLRRDLNLSDHELTIVSVGNLERRKGHEYLIRAFSIVRQSYSGCRLVIIGAGSGQTRNQLCDLIEALGLVDEVILAGKRDDTCRFIQACDMFVLSSLWESNSVAILEAMSVGLPVIASDVGGVSECVVDGKSGYLVPPRDPGKLAEKILKLLSSQELRERMGSEGRQRITRHYSSEVVVPKIESVLESFAQR